MAAPDIGTGDDGSQQMLNDAYAQARQSLQGAVPNGLLNSLTRDQPPPGAVSVSMGGGQTAEPPPGSVLADQPPEGASNPFDRTEPPPDAQPVAKESHGNGDMWSLSNMGDFIRDEFKGTGAELKTAVPRALGKLGKATTTLLGGAVASVADHAADVITGKALGMTHGAEDWVFNYANNYINPAIESLTPQRAGNVGQDEGSGGAAQAIGDATEMVPAMFAGPAGVVSLATQAGTNTATESIDRGHSLRTAAAEGAVDTVATAVQAMVPGGNLPLVKRVLTQVPAGDFAAIAGDYAKKKILESAGHQKEADQIDPLANLGEDTLQNIVFAVLGGHKEPKELPKTATPPPEAQPLPQPQAPQPAPPVVPAQAASPRVQPPSPTTPKAVGDTPSPEPAKDLQAQFKDMNDKATPRTGVLVPKGSEAAAGKTLEQAKTQGRAVELPQGTLILKNKAEFLKAKAALDGGQDPQQVIGRVTGAGEGKQPEQTMVVQGQKDGAVASESMVKPEEVPAKVAQMKAEGKEPVVTTPEAAVQRRADEIATEAQTLPTGTETPGAKSDLDFKGAFTLGKNGATADLRNKMWDAFQKGSDQAVRGIREAKLTAALKELPKDATREQFDRFVEAGEKPVTEEKPSDEEVEEQPAKRGIVTTKAGERAVILEGEPENGKQRVRLLDDEGEPSDQVISVPSEAVRGHSIHPSEAREAPAKEPSKELTSSSEGVTQRDVNPAKRDTAPALDQLREAAADFAKSQQPAKGRKYAGSVKDRAQDVSGFARALKAVASTMQGEDAAHAVDMAKKAERLDLKSDEAMAKGQGIGHTELSAHAENLLNAARKLYEPEFRRPEPKVAVQEKLKAKQAVKKAAQPELSPQEAKVASYRDERAARRALLESQDGADHKVAYQRYWKVLEDRGYTKAQIREEVDRVLQEHAAKNPVVMSAEESQRFNDRVLGRKKTEPEKVKVIEDVPDETKPVEPTKAQAAKLKKAGDALIRARDEDADARASDVEKVLHEIYGDRMPADDREAFMSYLMGERRDRLRPRSRDEEIDDELGQHGIDYRSAEPGEFEARILGHHEVSPEMAQLHTNLERSGMYPRMREMAGKGQFGARAVLQHMASVTGEGPLRDFIHKLAAHQPDGSVIHPVDVVRNRNGVALTSRGTADISNNRIQLRMNAGEDTRLSHALLHEAVHLATMHIMTNDPNHPAVREAHRLYEIFGQRMSRRLGDQVVLDHINYHRGLSTAPKNLINNLYGLHSPGEFMAEAMSNPKFQELIAESERFKDERAEGSLNGFHRLADAIVGTIRRALNIITRREAKLLHSVLRNVEDVMEGQRKMDVDRASAAQDLAAIAHLNDDPKPLKDEPRLRGIVGRTGSVLARQFYRTSQGRVVPALRRLVLKNETHDQIIRSNAHWFGKDDETNPLRQYDATVDQKNAIINRHLERARPIVLERQKLDRATDTALGNLQNDSTRWGIDPSKDKADVAAKYSKLPDFDQRWQDLQDRWNALPKEARHVYEMERDHYAWAQKHLRRTAVDAALDTFTDRDLSAAQRSLLYSARTKGDFDNLIGSGKLVDVGDRNDSLRKSLQELAAVNNITGPYFHLGRHGEWVVQVHPEVDQNFDTREQAEAHAQKIRDMGPGSKTKVAEVGGKWNVEGKAQYISMHKNRVDAEAEAQRLRDEGHKVGQVTQKVEAESGGALTQGMQSLVAGAMQKLARRGDGPEVKALGDALRGTLVQMVASRSAYAASKLARAGFAGVKGEEMGRNFASHAQSMAWNIGNLATTFKQGEALGHIREAAKRPGDDVPQKTVYKRGAVMDILGKRVAQEVSQYGLKNPVNAITSKLGYMNFLASPSHTGIYLTQNFTTAYPVAGARWGYGRSAAAFARATQAVVSPAMRATFKAAKPGEFGADDMTAHVIDAIKQHPTMSKWAPQLRELMDRGVITNTFAHEVGHMAQGGNATVQRVFDYARIMPQMAEVYNRVSTALAGLELSGGDLRKTADFVRETHVDYSQSNKTYMGKSIAKLPGANTVTMFRTYVQGMRHLLYSNIKNMVYAETKSRAEAAKTVAGLVVAMSLTAGAIKGAALEPLRGAVYAYNKVFGNDDEFYSLDNSIRRFVASAVGNKTLSDAITGGLPRLLGFDLSGRMGLSDLFLHDPPDLFGTDKTKFMEFLGEQLGGPIGQMVAEQKDAFKDAMARGDAFGMLAALVPVKIVRDSLKAMELATTGHKAGNGAVLTKPSVADAAIQLAGFKPSSVARVQEKQGDVKDYRQFISQRKDAIMGAWAKLDGSERAAFKKSTVDPFNRANPGDRIKVQDLIKQQRSAQRSEQRIETGNDKNPNVRKLLEY
jgi:hypothetical protein